MVETVGGLEKLVRPPLNDQYETIETQMAVEKPYLCSSFRGSTFATDWVFKVPTVMIGWLSVAEGFLYDTKKKTPRDYLLSSKDTIEVQSYCITVFFLPNQREKKKESHSESLYNWLQPRHFCRVFR